MSNRSCRISIEPSDWDERQYPNHYSGGECLARCPNCNNAMMTAFSINGPDAMCCVSPYWSTRRVSVLFCPSCALYMEQYWITQTSTSPEIIGGYRDGGEILNDIEPETPVRQITLQPLRDEEFTHDRIQERVRRAAECGVYHQLGGHAFKTDAAERKRGQVSFLRRFRTVVFGDAQNPPRLPCE